VRVGFVVGRPVGNAVTRNRVKRRLRHLAAQHLPSTPGGVDLVVRALPRAAVAGDHLITDLDQAWVRAATRLGAQPVVGR
jgi:ribonuclease P protein component